MDHMKQTIQNTTLGNSLKSTFKIPKPYDIVKGNCKKCNEEFDCDYKMDLPHTGTTRFESEICYSCNKKEEDERFAKETEEEYKRLKANRLMKMFDEQSLINPKLKNASFDNYKPTSIELEKSKAVCYKYKERFDKDNPINLLMTGSYGVGKSHLAVSIIKGLIDKELTGIFISTPKLLSKFRSTCNKDSNVNEGQLMELLINVDCLVLDDLGTEKSSDWALEKLFEIIDSRMGKHTIYTTNYAPEELRQRIGERNFSRVMDDTHVIYMTGDDYRLKRFS